MRRILVAMAAATSLIGADAFAYDLIVQNCMSTTLRVVTFDEGDVVTMIPFAEYEIASRAAGVVRCNSPHACKVRVFYGDVGEEFKTGETLYVHLSPLVGIYRRPFCEI